MSEQRLSDTDRQRINRQLVAEGERICKCCVGRFVLDQFTPTHKDGRIYYSTNCKRCTSMIRAERWRADPDYRQRHHAVANAYAKRNRARQQANQRQLRERKRRQKFARILGVAS